MPSTGAPRAVPPTPSTLCSLHDGDDGDGRCDRLRYECLVPYDVMAIEADGVCDRSEPALVNGAGVASRYETSWHRAVMSRLKRVLKQFTGTWRMHNYVGYDGNACDASPAAAASSAATEGASVVHAGAGCDDSSPRDTLPQTLLV
jgi:hypothetical protein